jgi:DNA-binding HxlR family transcriptional regulator
MRGITMETYEEFKIAVNDGNMNYRNSPVRKTMKLLEEKYEIEVIYELCGQDFVGFTQLRARLPIMTNTRLKNTLLELEEQGLVVAHWKDPLAESEFSLSQEGHEMLPIFYEMYKWAKKYLPFNKNNFQKN